MRSGPSVSAKIAALVLSQRSGKPYEEPQGVLASSPLDGVRVTNGDVDRATSRSSGPNTSANALLLDPAPHHSRQQFYSDEQFEGGAPEGMRKLTDAERVHECVYTWSPALGTLHLS